MPNLGSCATARCVNPHSLALHSEGKQMRRLRAARRRWANCGRSSACPTGHLCAKTPSHNKPPFLRRTRALQGWCPDPIRVPWRNPMPTPGRAATAAARPGNRALSTIADKAHHEAQHKHSELPLSQLEAPLATSGVGVASKLASRAIARACQQKWAESQRRLLARANAHYRGASATAAAFVVDGSRRWRTWGRHPPAP